MKDVPPPMPMSANVKNRVGKNAVCSPAPASSARPAAIAARPGTSVRLAPKGLTSRAVGPEDRTATISVMGRKARPICMAS